MDAPQNNASQGDTAQAHPPTPHRRRHKFTVRSRDGCVTCKQRKVKCDEQRPRCSHCERLNVECNWMGTSRQAIHTRHPGTATSVDRNSPMPTPTSASPRPVTPPDASHFSTQGQQVLPEVFDFASFIYDGRDAWQHMSLDGMSIPQGLGHDNNQAQTQMPIVPQFVPLRRNGMLHEPSEPSGISDTSPQVPQDQEYTHDSAENDRLINYFTHAVTPPILSEVEAQKNWVTMRKILIKMAGDSRMVRWAVLAFSNVMLCRQDGDWMASQQNYYGNAATEVALCDNDTEALAKHSTWRENSLATLFLLSYVDILEARIEGAQVHLKRAYKIFQQGQKEKGGFTPTEKQLLLWIRLLDARAVPAGGDGLFLSKDNEDLLVQASPASFGGETDEAGNDDIDDAAVEDILFHALYQPGIMFFQKVQSFMGHIAKIDPWHRSRGTVEDETEVMSIAASIATDLRALYEQRPSLMDCAVAGKLTARHLSATLAFTITRAFRTYMASYYACKIHLHRVAYKNFPLTAEAVEAMDHIRKLTKLVAQGLETDEPLPINMLWPLVMLGTEEQDQSERAWIKAQIMCMEKIAGNARITAQVLDEVQARQDAAKVRVDIGSVMREIFDVRFAIV